MIDRLCDTINRALILVKMVLKLKIKNDDYLCSLYQIQTLQNDATLTDRTNCNQWSFLFAW